MTDEWTRVRREYAERVGLQSLQMMLVAARADDETMRDELRACAMRLSSHAERLRNCPAYLASGPA